MKNCKCGCGKQTSSMTAEYIRSHRPGIPIAIRFWQKVKKDCNNGCWIWLGAKNAEGYGQLQSGKRSKKITYAHRLSYELHFGSTLGLCVLHRCDNPPCVNPKHLFLGTKSDNNKDTALKNRMPFGEEHWNYKHGRYKTKAI